MRRKEKNKKIESKKYVRVWNVNLFLKGSSENEQMWVCLTERSEVCDYFINGKRNAGIEVV